MKSGIMIFGPWTMATLLTLGACSTNAQTTVAQQRKVAAAARAQLKSQPWMNTSLSPDERADLVLREMTLDEKIQLLHGNGMAHSDNWQMPLTRMSNGGAGYIAPIERLWDPRHRYVGRRLRCALLRRKWPVFNCATQQRRRGGELGSQGCL